MNRRQTRLQTRTRIASPIIAPQGLWVGGGEAGGEDARTATATIMTAITMTTTTARAHQTNHRNVRGGDRAQMRTRRCLNSGSKGRIRKPMDDPWQPHDHLTTTRAYEQCVML